jgi:hypothetical protein
MNPSPDAIVAHLSHLSQKKTALEPPFRCELLNTVEALPGLSSEPGTPLLPATYRTRHHQVRLVSSDINSFLECDLDVHRLNAIHSWLWLCGLPTSPRALHYQRLKSRDIVHAEQFDLHLVWSAGSTNRIFIKPLPRYMLSPQFWREHLCPSINLYRTALGFLLSYVALVERQADFNIAINTGLIPSELTWSGWLVFAEEVVNTSAQSNAYFSDFFEPQAFSTLDAHVPVNPRFYYGELRLGRLNWISRIVQGTPRGYFSNCTTYGSFMRENVNSLITLFAYTTIVLSAMQVGLTTQFLESNYAFGMAAYVFTLFALLVPLAAIAAILMIILVQFVVNLVRTVKIRRMRRRQGAGV